MKDLKNLINCIFSFSTDDKDDNIKILFSKYQVANEEEKSTVLQILVDVLHNIKIFNLNKWCLILSQLISYSLNESKSLEHITQILIPNPDQKTTPTEIIGRKLGLLILTNHLTPTMNDIKIGVDVLLKLLFFISQFIDDKVIGIMACFILSRFVNSVSTKDFNQNMIPILKLIFSKDNHNINNLYLILLSLKEEQVLLLKETPLPNYKLPEELTKFIETFKKLNNNIISVYFTSFANSDLFESFWNLFKNSLEKEKMNYQECGAILTCLIETICPSESASRDTEDLHRKMHVLRFIWKDPHSWKLFFSHLSEEKSLFQSLCRNAVVQLRSKSTHLDDISDLFFELFLTAVDMECHLLESKISPNFRLSQSIIPKVRNVNHLIKYINLLTEFSKLKVVTDKEKVFLIDQIAFVCLSFHDRSVHNTCIERIITISVNELVKMDSLSEVLKRSSYSSLISCIHHSVTSQDLSMNKLILYLKSIINMVIVHLNEEPNKFKRLLTIFKSLGKYIDDKLEFQYVNELIVTKVFPCFGSIICYLSLFLLTKIALDNFEQSMGFCNQIIDWIKDCFQAAYKSIELSKDEEEQETRIPHRKRMLSISSLCSDIEEESLEKSNHWSFFMFDILLKVYDEDSTLMNETVNNIVSLMIQKNIIDISGVRYIKNLILLEKARKKKISELDQFIASNHNNTDDPIKLRLKSIHFQERCLNILSVIILEGHDVEMIASCLFIMLEICSNGDKVLINKIEKTVKIFKEQSKLIKPTYLNEENVKRAIDSILTLSNDSLKYENSVEMTSNMIIGLINRIKLDEDVVNFFKMKLEDNLYGCIDHFQKNILQSVFMEHIELTWYMRKILLECLEKSNSNRFTKYKVLSIMSSVIKIYRSQKEDAGMDNFEEFVKDAYPVIINILSSLNFESLNAKYVSIMLECLIGFTVSNFGKFVMQSELLDKLKKVLLDKKNSELFAIINKFLEIYECRDFNLKMLSLERLHEYDQHISYLLKLLPTEFSKDFENSETISTKSFKPPKEPKVLSKFSLVNQKKPNKVQNDKNEKVAAANSPFNNKKRTEKRKSDTSIIETPHKKKIKENEVHKSKTKEKKLEKNGEKKKLNIEHSESSIKESNKNHSGMEISFEKKKKKKSKDKSQGESESVNVHDVNISIENSIINNLQTDESPKKKKKSKKDK